ncbi:trithorax group protein osa-like [Ischnura elegans]|uniref:trithorax group protein osa-like n=1 Tax=Ischnura elegans TaxID=197161 RepID=UPI001ED89263|nr:trithorax group protein osa-like [Ischnura elegans]
MAATQAESQQQNEVNCEQVQQDQTLDIGNTGLQNGTEKNGGRGLLAPDSVVINTKAKSPGQNSLPVEMSQYRQESGAGPPLHNSTGNSETNTNNSDVDGGKLSSEGKSFTQNSEPSAGSDGNFVKVSESGGQNMQGFGVTLSARGNYHPDQQHGVGNPVQNSADTGNLHQNHPFSQFGQQGMRHGFPQATKPIPSGPMVPPRPPSAGPNVGGGGFPPHGSNAGASVPGGPQQQQRFMSGQSISQPTGPTPTLNQLLQSSNPAAAAAAVHRYHQNSGYGAEYGPGTGGNMPGSQKGGVAPNVSGEQQYNQSWPPQRPLASYSPHQVASGYRNQPQSVACQTPPQSLHAGGPMSDKGPLSILMNSFCLHGGEPRKLPGVGQGRGSQQAPFGGGPSGGGGGSSYQGSQQGPGAGGQPPQQQSGGSPYPPYPHRYPTPPGQGPGGPGGRPPHPPGQGYSPHQLAYGQVYGDQQHRAAWAQHHQHHPHQHPPPQGQAPPPPAPPSSQPPPPQQPPQQQGQPPPPQQQQQQPNHQQQPASAPQQQASSQQQPPPPPSASSFPSRPQQPSTPNAHAPDAGRGAQHIRRPPPWIFVVVVGAAVRNAPSE